MEMLFFMVIAWLPGLIAEVRNHRHVSIVSLLGFVALWIHWILWIGALVWAWKGPTKPESVIV